MSANQQSNLIINKEERPLYLSFEKRECKKCKEEKLLETSFIRYNKNAYRWTCKECFNSNINKWRRDNKEVCNDYHTKWRRNNPSYFNEYLKTYKKEHYDPVKKHNQYIIYYYRELNL
ncbi:MAG: hypothetical protein RL086_876 [Bacteroidota bacterium]|jgi:hypothetical protein